MRYGKLIQNGTGIEVAPATLTVNGVLYGGAIPKEVYISQGYYPIKSTVQPPNTREAGFEIVNGAIQRVYVPYTQEEMSDMEAMVTLSGEEAEAYEAIKTALEEALNG